MADLTQGRTYRLEVADCCIEGVTFVGVLAEVEYGDEIPRSDEPVGYVFRNGPCELRLDNWQVPNDIAEVSALDWKAAAWPTNAVEGVAHEARE